MSTCEHGQCSKTTEGRYCPRHHEYFRSRGEVGMTPTGPVLEHIEKLQALGWDCLMIARESGVSHSGVRHLHLHPVCRRSTANPILRLPLVPGDSPRMSSSVGVVRMIQALQANDWGYRDIAAEGRMSFHALVAVANGKRTPSFWTVQAMREVFAKIGDTTGPSPLAGARARARGYLRAAAWENIEDPNEVPAVSGEDVVDDVAVQRYLSGHTLADTLTVPEKYAAAAVMIRRGVGSGTAAKKLGLNWKSIRKLAEEAAA